MAINYRKQEIIFKGEIKDTEELACIYLRSCGYSKAFKTSRMKAFPQYGEILDNYSEIMNDVTGRPDVICIAGKKIHLYEIKKVYDEQHQDSLRQSQLEWHERHPMIDFTVLYLKISEEEESKKYRLLEKENEKLKAFLLDFDFNFIKTFKNEFINRVKDLSEDIYIEIKKNDIFKNEVIEE